MAATILNPGNFIINNVDYIVNLRHNEIMSNPSDILFITKDGSIRNIRS